MERRRRSSGRRRRRQRGPRGGGGGRGVAAAAAEAAAWRRGPSVGVVGSLGGGGGSGAGSSAPSTADRILRGDEDRSVHVSLGRDAYVGTMRVACPAPPKRDRAADATSEDVRGGGASARTFAHGHPQKLWRKRRVRGRHASLRVSDARPVTRVHGIGRIARSPELRRRAFCRRARRAEIRQGGSDKEDRKLIIICVGAFVVAFVAAFCGRTRTI